MGHFSYTCKLSGLPITGGDPAVLIIMKMRERLYDCSEKHLKKYGSTSLVSNDSTQVKFQPVWFPICGDYDDYGRLENIKEDDNTKLLENYYGLPIKTIMDIVTSGRKDDGYDNSLKVIKKPVIMPDDAIEGEDWFVRYQRIENDPTISSPDVSGTSKGDYEGWRVWRDGKKVKATKEEYDADFKIIHEQYARYKVWCEKNPDPTDDYDNPQYEERYNELLTYSGMWVHGEFYDELTKKDEEDEYDKVDLGTPEILKVLGFEEIEKDKKAERYDRQFKKGKLVVHSDGTWINVKKESIYTLSSFKEYCQKKGEDIDIDKINKKGRVEQIFDYILPNVESISNSFDAKYELMDQFELLSEEEQKGEAGQKLLIEALRSLKSKPHPMERTFKYLLLNKDEYEVSNPMTIKYFEAAKEGKIRDNMVRFWRFNSYMYCTGRYYDIVGTAPQDGAHEAVMRVLKVASKVLRKELKERADW